MTGATITHASRGRVRVHVSGTAMERRRALNALEHRLRDRGGILINPRASSALFTYDPQELDPDAIVGLLKEADEAFSTLTPPSLRRGADRGMSTAAADVYGRFSAANRSVLQATHGRLDLRMLFPVTLAGLALRQVARNGLGFHSAPWYVLAYYAFDSYVKLHADDVRTLRS